MADKQKILTCYMTFVICELYPENKDLSMPAHGF